MGASVVARMCVLTSLKKDVKSVRPGYIPEYGSHVVFVLCALFLPYSRILRTCLGTTTSYMSRNVVPPYWHSTPQSGSYSDVVGIIGTVTICTVIYYVYIFAGETTDATSANVESTTGKILHMRSMTTYGKYNMLSFL